MSFNGEVISTLAFADSIHDFGRSAIDLAWVILEDLPATISKLINERTAIKYAEEQTGRKFTNVTASTPNAIFRQLGGTETRPIAIVCDASFCSPFIKNLVTNTIGKVYIIRNRERNNDQGTNPSFDGLSLFADELYNDTIIYPSYKDDTNINNKFGSLYDIGLSKTDIICYKNMNEYDRYPFENNSVKDTNIDMLVFNLLRNQLLNNDISVIKDLQFRFLQKRSGDFLQILSCADKERMYIMDGEEKNLRDVNVYFCSADRIPCAYALSLGINCIQWSRTGVQYFKNMEIHSNDITSEYETLTRDKSDTTHKLIWLIQTHKTLSEQLLEKIRHVNTAESVEDIKKCIQYAYNYSLLQTAFGNMHEIKYILETFINNPDNELLKSYTYKRTIITQLKFYNSLYTKYSSFNIDASFYDKTFNDFDPLVFRKIFQNYELKKTQSERIPKEKYKNPYGAMYGVTLLSGLSSDPLLKEFVIQCAKRIIHIANRSNKRKSAKVYKFFLMRYAEYHSGGSDDSSDLDTIPNDEDYKDMADECMQFLTDSTNMDIYNMQRLRIRETNSVGIPIIKIIHEMLQYISIHRGMYIPKYINYLLKMPTDKLSDIQKQIVEKQFLKRQNTRRINAAFKTIKARTQKQRHRK